MLANMPLAKKSNGQAQIQRVEKKLHFLIGGEARSHRKGACIREVIFANDLPQLVKIDIWLLKTQRNSDDKYPKNKE